MSNPFSFLKPLSKKLYVGVDIGTASIKIALLEKAGDGLSLKNYGMLENRGHLERVNDAIQTSSLKILDKETAQLIISLLGEMNLGAKEVVASLPAFSAFTALLEIPVMSAEETAQAMQYQAKQFVPMPLTEVTIDWIPVGERTGEKGVKKQQVFLVSIPNEQIKKYRSIFSTAGLDLKFLEVETVSSARILTAGDPTTTLIIDIGARSTALAIGAGGLLKYSGQTDYAGSSLTQAVSRGLGISIQRAENLKRSRGLTGTKGEYEVSTLMLPYLDVILSEARRVTGTYERSYGDKVDRIVLSGGGANLLGIEKYVSDQFKLPTTKANPFRDVKYAPAAAPIVNSLGGPFAVAFGLSMKQLTGGAGK